MVMVTISPTFLALVSLKNIFEAESPGQMEPSCGFFLEYISFGITVASGFTAKFFGPQAESNPNNASETLFNNIFLCK